MYRPPTPSGISPLRVSRSAPSVSFPNELKSALFIPNVLPWEFSYPTIAQGRVSGERSSAKTISAPDARHALPACQERTLLALIVTTSSPPSKVPSPKFDAGLRFFCSTANSPRRRSVSSGGRWVEPSRGRSATVAGEFVGAVRPTRIPLRLALVIRVGSRAPAHDGRRSGCSRLSKPHESLKPPKEFLNFLLPRFL